MNVRDGASAAAKSVPRRYIAPDDPRRQPRVTPRDLRALLFIGRGYEVAQYQLHEAIFTGLAEGIMSRWTQRMLRREIIAVERWGKVGINRLRLTKAGRDLLVAHGKKVEDVFTPKTATALKDIQHTLWINDLRVVLPTLLFRRMLLRPRGCCSDACRRREALFPICLRSAGHVAITPAMCSPPRSIWAESV